MNKHGNVFFPQDQVVKHPEGNTVKTAAIRRGKVVDVDSSGADVQVKVAWDDGTETYEDPSTLSK